MESLAVIFTGKFLFSFEFSCNFCILNPMITGKYLYDGAVFRRKRGNKSLKVIAERCGLSSSRLSNYESNRSRPDPQTLLDMFHVYGISLTDFEPNRELRK